MKDVTKSLGREERDVYRFYCFNLLYHGSSWCGSRSDNVVYLGLEKGQSRLYTKSVTFPLLKSPRDLHISHSAFLDLSFVKCSRSSLSHTIFSPMLPTAPNHLIASSYPSFSFFTSRPTNSIHLLALSVPIGRSSWSKTSQGRRVDALFLTDINVSISVQIDLIPNL